MLSNVTILTLTNLTRSAANHKAKVRKKKLKAKAKSYSRRYYIYNTLGQGKVLFTLTAREKKAGNLNSCQGCHLRNLGS